MYYTKNSVWTTDEVEEMRAIKKSGTRLLLSQKPNRFLSLLKKLFFRK